MNTKKLIIIFLIAQLLLTVFSIHKDADWAIAQETVSEIFDILGLFLFIAFWSIFFAIFVVLIKRKNIFAFISKFAFLLISGSNILMLLYISFSVIVGGPLEEGGIIFIWFPITGFYISIASIVLATIIYFIKDLLIIIKLSNKLKKLLKII